MGGGGGEGGGRGYKTGRRDRKIRRGETILRVEKGKRRCGNGDRRGMKKWGSKGEKKYYV